MSELIARETQKLEQGDEIVMFEIDATAWGEGFHRFTPGPIGGPSALFNGNEYISYPVTASGFKWDGNGTPPRPTLKVTAIDRVFLALVRGANDLVGAPVTRLRTFRQFLDDGETPDSQSLFPTEHYRVERKSKQNSVEITFELSVGIDQQGKMIPGRQVIRDSCMNTYRVWNGSQFVYTNVTCPYAGGNYYSKGGAVEIEPALDVCGKEISDCKLRFGQNAELPFNAFPGVGRTR